MPDRTPLDLIHLQAAALFRFDAAGRITGTNEPDPTPGPRLFLGRSREGSVWRFGTDVSDDLAAGLDGILRREPIEDDLEALPVCFDALVRLLESHAPVASIWSGPAWVVPAGVSPAPWIAVASNLGPRQCAGALPMFASDTAPAQPYAAVVVDRCIVSVCSCARITDDVSEAGLQTVAAHRGRGYGGATTAAWAAAVRATGRIPLYSTSWDNHASRRVAAKLGLVRYGVDLSIT
ncbi:MAG: GNAT family N-acetyltransferase [Chloroflexota bacterium]|nr:GNAT family N-acetyltransferase [Chloroflexota bacterium]